MSRRHIPRGPAVISAGRGQVSTTAKGNRDIRHAIPFILIAVAGFVAYADSFDGAFVLDDVRSIVENRLIQAPASIVDMLQTRRPVVTLSLALNHALGGLDVRGYHLFNLTVHILAAMTLYGVIRRTLLIVIRRTRPGVESPGGAAVWTAAAVTLIWTVHPLQTQSVTYIIQRSESLMGMFYLLTLYCLIRGAESASRRGIGWYVACVACCAMGMGSKAVMVSAPIVALLYDRVFLAASIRDVLRRRWLLHLGLAATWGVLVFCGVAGAVLSSRHTGIVNVGFSLRELTPAEYALTQPGVILHYLRLAFWPHPLCLDYAWPVAKGIAAIAPAMCVIVLLIAATLWALRRKPALGFVGMWFWLILAPTSSIVPIRDPAFEHRMYLPLAGVIVCAVLGVRALLARITHVDAAKVRRLGVVAACVALVPLTIATILRNHDYSSELVMWGDVVAERPDNPRGRNNYGLALLNAGRAAEAAEQFDAAVRLDPDYDAAMNNYGLALAELGRYPEAIEQYRRAVASNEGHYRAHNNIANALMKLGRFDEAIEHFERAVAIKPDYEKAHNNYGAALAQLGRPDDALSHLQRAIELDPRYAEAHANLGNAYAQRGDLDRAAACYRRAIEIDPDFAPAHNNLGSLLARRGEYARALSCFADAFRIDPQYFDAGINMAKALMKLGDRRQAVEILRLVAQRDPNNAAANRVLADISRSQD